MNTDPRAIISTSPMSRMQLMVVAITMGVNALDGFDVLAISFASPGIAAEWGIDRAVLGIVLSMELLGMAIGAVVLGGVADKFGRRPTMLGCLIVMSMGMFMCTTATSTLDLSLWRVPTGFGIGGIVATLNTVVAEYSNDKRRHLCISLMITSYSVGAVVGGTIAAQLLQVYSWRSVFFLGAAITAAFVPLVYFFIPESVHWLARQQPKHALRRINATLARMGHAAIRSLPALPAEIVKRPVTDLFAPGLLAITLTMTFTYFFHIMTFYFILKWVPKIVVDMGFAASSAAGVLVWANVGGALGGVALGILTHQIGVKALTIGFMLLSTLSVIIFGHTPSDLTLLAIISTAAGFFTNGAVVGIYAILAQAFPTHVRASGTGFTAGLGRGGSLVAPIVAGFLFSSGVGLPTVAFTMALGSLFAAGTLAFLKLKP